MKKCAKCGASVEDQFRFCSLCGSAKFTAEEPTPQPQQYQQYTYPSPDMPAAPQPQQYTYPSPDMPAATPQPAPQPVPSAPEVDINDNGNVIVGIIGAFLFSLIGGFLYFLIYQLDIIAGICGLAIFVLANFGYRLFAGTKNKASIVGLIVSIIMMCVTIYLSEYLCVSYAIYDAYNSVANSMGAMTANVTFMDAIDATPTFLENSEVHEAFVKDLAFAYVFGFLASVGNISAIIKARKNK